MFISQPDFVNQRPSFYKTKLETTEKGNILRLWSFETKTEKYVWHPLRNALKNCGDHKKISKKNMYLYLWSPSGGGRKLRSSTYHWVYWSLGKSHIIVAQHFPPHWTLRTHFLRENTWGKCQTSLLAGSFKKVRWRDKTWEQTLRKNTGSGREGKW